MIELNFGPSEYARYSREEEPDMIVQIHETGELRRLSKKELDNMLADAVPIVSSMTPEKSGRTFRTVEFELERDSLDLEKRMILPWIDERGEWVAITYNKWVESMPRNDENYAGPFKPNDYCARKIAQAYGISAPDINLDAMLKTGHETIMKMTAGQIAPDKLIDELYNLGILQYWSGSDDYFWLPIAGEHELSGITVEKTKIRDLVNGTGSVEQDIHQDIGRESRYNDGIEDVKFFDGSASITFDRKRLAFKAFVAGNSYWDTS